MHFSGGKIYDLSFIPFRYNIKIFSKFFLVGASTPIEKTLSKIIEILKVSLEKTLFKIT